MRWQEKLTQAELKHIKDTTKRGTLEEFKRNRKAHRAWALADGQERCYECRIIARKLGLEV